MKATITANAILAASKCAATKDIRFYLNGVCVSYKKGDVAMCYGTNRHICFFGQALMTFQEFQPPFEIIIPLDVIKKIDKKKITVDLEKIEETTWMIDGIRFTPIDGKFPDVSRILPDFSTFKESPAIYDPDLLVRSNEALRIFNDGKKSVTYPIMQRENESGWMHAGRNDCGVVIMPIRKSATQSFDGFSKDFM
jgi:hypothetical protein